jgi:hypothetical protein
MPRGEAGSTSGRFIVQKFAAHLAHLLNTGDGSANLDPGELYRKLLRTLSGGSEGRAEGNPYVDTLIALHLLGPDMTADQAAAVYFERVLNRPLFLARRGHYHRGHELLLALCRRDLDGRWEGVELVRSSTPVPDDNSFEEVGARLREVRDRHKGRISSGNPAASTRAEFGPLYLKLSTSGVEVPEELSLWEAVCCAPRVLRVLSSRDFDGFCSLMIKALETANAPYGALVTLRLSPLDWAEELSLNTAKKVSAFLSDVRDLAQKREVAADAEEVWQEVWPRRQIPGFPSARAFRSSPLGHALRMSAALSSPAPLDREEEDEGEKEAKLDTGAIPSMVQRYVREGALDSYDAWLLRQLTKDKTLHQLARSPRTLFKFGRAEIPESYVQELFERVRRHRLRSNPSR